MDEKKKKIVIWSVIGGSVLLLGIVLFCFISGTIIATLNGMNTPKSSATSPIETKPPAPREEPKPSPPKETKIIPTVSAQRLLEEYQNNEVAADNKYANKRIRITGRIAQITVTFGTPEITLETNDFVAGVVCNFDRSDKESLSYLSKGQWVKIEGDIDGFMGGLSVIVNNCRIVE